MPAAFTKQVPGKIVKNGDYQQIMWLGAAGFIVVNPLDRQILLIDPWPSFGKGSREWTNRKTPHQRLVDLARWLRCKVDSGYSLAGILVGHEHYDHYKDVPLLLDSLAQQRTNMGRPCSGAQMPTVYCDSLSAQILGREGAYAGITIQEIRLKSGGELIYDDCDQCRLVRKKAAGYPLKAGIKLNKLSIGAFEVTPYIWDHCNTMMFDVNAFVNAASGHYQRQSAFLIACKNDPANKRLFVNGSAGEMNFRYTGGHVKSSRIEADILLQAVTIDTVANARIYRDQLDALAQYQAQCIDVRDKIIAAHYEDFFGRRIDGPNKVFDHSYRVANYVEALKRHKPEHAAKVWVMKRFGFEHPYPPA